MYLKSTRPLRNGLSFSDFLKTLKIVVTNDQASTGNTSVTGTNFQSSTPVQHVRSSLSVNKSLSWSSKTVELISGYPMYSDFLGLETPQSTSVKQRVLCSEVLKSSPVRIKQSSEMSNE